MSHSADFTDGNTPHIINYFYVNLYDEKIDANVLRKDNELILIHNTYLSSSAYNLNLCWLYCQDRFTDDLTYQQELDKLLKHNFKKFFAEQLFSHRNTIFSRSVLLETLLYEQLHMVPVFAAKDADSTLNKRAGFSADLMSNLISFHELGHIFLGTNDDLWSEMLVAEQETLQDIYSYVKQSYPKEFVVEFQCDTIAILSTMSQYDNQVELSYLINSIIFGFSSFAVMVSLMKSAKHTNSKHKEIRETVNFASIEKQERNYDYFLGRDNDFIERAKLAMQVCRKIAEIKGIAIFEHCNTFPLKKTIVNDLLQFIDRIMESEDTNARSMSLLIAESLHSHPQGIEFIYLRSKTFTSNRGALKL
ncbi:MAG: hypothetical protein AAF632_20625 [Bacteroidota bacterium]